MKTVVIKGEDGSVAIEVLSYERNDTSNPSDANWLSSTVKIAVMPFSGEFALALTTHDFVSFATDLEIILRDLRGRAEFKTPEDVLAFSVEMTSLGHAVVKGYARPSGGRSELSFEFSTDQSYLAATGESLSELARTFPVRRS